VLCHGKVLLQNKKLLTIDKVEIQNEVQNRLSRLSQRLPGKRIAYYPTSNT
jgi:5-methylthioadenosine/S-adenosylhomocysteine deaminase